MTILYSGSLLEEAEIRLSCSPEEEKRIVKKLMKKAEANQKEGNTYYLISTKWFIGWRKYVGLDDVEDLIGTLSGHSQNEVSVETSVRPGPIDNRNIVMDNILIEKDEPHLIRGLVEEKDYVLVPVEVWEVLFAWYTGGPPLRRKMISQGSPENKFVVEVYPLLLNLIDSADGNSSVIQISKKDSVRKLYEKVCLMTEVDEDKILLYDYFDKLKCTVLPMSDKSLEEFQLLTNHNILFEMRGDRVPTTSLESGTDSALASYKPSSSSLSIDKGPLISNDLSTSDSSSVYDACYNDSGTSGTRPVCDTIDASPTVGSCGLAGLQNLANTCYMNSAVQCLVHTPPLVKYFLDGYSDDINSENLVGMKGELTRAFGGLLRELWRPGVLSVEPRSFKDTISRFARQFSGNAQHDSQEFLDILLNGLREDLNHRDGNDSLTVDVFQGEYKSTLTCTDCAKTSITYDTFTSLSLPLPSATNRKMAVTVISGDGRASPMVYTVTVQTTGSVQDLVNELYLLCSLNEDECLFLAEVYENKIFKYFENAETSLSSIKDEDILVAYRFQKNQYTRTILEIYHGKEFKDTFRAVEYRPFGCPLMVYLDENNLTGEGLCSTVCRVLSPFRKKQSTSQLQSVEDADHYKYTDAIEKHCDPLTVDVGNTDILTVILIRNLYLLTRYGSEIPLDERTFLLSGHTVKVILHWTDEVQELFDSSLLDNIPLVISEVTVKKSKKESLTLFACLESFLKEEPLGSDNKCYCHGCKKYREATKKIDLWRLPDILIFHLKRFAYSRFGNIKLDDFVDFPIDDLDLTQYVKSEEFSSHSNVYELYAIINHFGELGEGHYTSYAKLNEGKWFHFDDSVVTPVSEPDIKTSAAYVLFYQKAKGKKTMESTHQQRQDA